jgi:hypothetical protein
MIGKEELLDALASITGMHGEVAPIFQKSLEALLPADKRPDPRAIALASRYQRAMQENEGHLRTLEDLINQIGSTDRDEY